MTSPKIGAEKPLMVRAHPRHEEEGLKGGVAQAFGLRGCDYSDDHSLMRTSPPVIHPRLHKIELLLVLLLVPVLVNLINK
jgi:hypothetical protein